VSLDALRDAPTVHFDRGQVGVIDLGCDGARGVPADAR
jgi:hypothetical protein